MCDNCSDNNSEQELNEMELDDHRIAGMALSIIGVLVENYCEEGYCDPTMYKALEVAETLAKKLGEQGLAERLATAKMYAGETVNKMIDEFDIPVGKGEWS
jgi:hypothetical protein